MATQTTRRSFLRTTVSAAAIAAGGSLLPTTIRAEAPTTSPSGARRVLRFAHPTDIHVQPERHGAEGMTAGFKHMMSLADPPKLILTGGDLPMDTASADQTRSKALWDLFNRIIATEVPKGVPVQHTLGNHDIWGRDKQACGAKGDEAIYGKKWFLDLFGYKETYRSFDMAGWHFIVLDSFDLDPNSKDYTAHIIGAQLEWLKQDLKATPATTPIIISSHVPILSAANFFDNDKEAAVAEGPDIVVSRKRMHVDRVEMDALFTQHPNVKLCLSGHLHLLDRVEYNHVTYICDGALSGDKWKGVRRHTPEGYGLIDLFADGSFQHQYVAYGWKAG